MSNHHILDRNQNDRVRALFWLLVSLLWLFIVNNFLGALVAFHCKQPQFLGCFFKHLIKSLYAEQSPVLNLGKFGNRELVIY